MGETRNAYKILVRKPKGNRPLIRPRYRWDNSIRIVLRETGWEGVEWMHVALDRVQYRDFVNITNFQVP